MLPITLEMNAFGPFSQKEIIDFQSFGESSLFLINGPTGSGKTSILDAMCFALYGETTGNERMAKEMRCDFASAEQLTQILFTFRLASGLYKVLRIPEQTRPKAKGDGVTQQSAKATLWKIEGKDEILLVAKKVGEANEKIAELTGLSSEQFRQVMILPQGKFREFLLAGSQDRETIFRQLFQTHIYSQIENNLKEQEKNIVNEIRQIEMQLQGVYHASSCENDKALVARISQAQADKNQLHKEKSLVIQSHDKAIEEVNKASQLAEKFDQQRGMMQKLSVLLEKDQQVELSHQELTIAKEAKLLSPLYTQWKRADKTHENVMSKYLAAEAELNAAKLNVEEADKASDRLDKNKTNQEKLKNELLQFQRLEGIHESLKSDNHDLSKIENQKNLIETNFKQLEMERDSNKKQRVELEDKLVEILKKLEASPQKKHHFEKMEVIRKLNTDLTLNSASENKLKKNIDKLGDDVLAKQNNLKDLVRARESLEKDRNNAQAYLLAKKLEDNEPCLVCGGVEHPSPAKLDIAIPDEAEINLAKENEKKLQDEIKAKEKALAEETTNYRVTISAIGAIKEQLGDYLNKTKDEIDQEFQCLVHEITELEKAEKNKRKINDNIASLKEAEKSHEISLVSSRQELDRITHEHMAIKAKVTQRLNEIPEAFRTPEKLMEEKNNVLKASQSLAEDIANIEKKQKAAQDAMMRAEATYLTLKQEKVRVNEDLQKDLSEWNLALQNSQIENQSQFESSLREDDWITQTEKNIRAHQDNKLLVQRELSEINQKLEGKVCPDLTEIRNREKELLTNKNKVIEKYHATDTILSQLLETQKKIQQLQKKQLALEEKYAVVGTLSKIANGDNSYRLSLQRYVLSVLLDDVLIEAGYRLQLMSKGRYTLNRKTDVSDFRSKSGLDLEVEDAYTGRVRSVATLSGGESFMAALSLALGLSDVVQAYAGGIHLDTLFIDEGFGSLDSESLELAMTALVDLQSSGKMIGVISHVSELKEVIGMRLDLIASKTGSHTQLVSCS